MLTLGEILKVKVAIKLLSAFVEEDVSCKILFDAFFNKIFIINKIHFLY